MASYVEIVIVVAANVLGAAMSLPQAVRLVRTRIVAGVSPTWVGMSVVTNAWWVAYGVALRSAAILPVAAVSVAGYLTIWVALGRSGGSRRSARTVPAVLALAVAPAVALGPGGWAGVGMVLGLGYGVQLAPAVISAVRSADLRGVSAGTWALAWVEALLWGVYGAPRGDVGLLTLGLTGVTLSSVVLVRLCLARLRRTDRATSGAVLAG